PRLLRFLRLAHIPRTSPSRRRSCASTRLLPAPHLPPYAWPSQLPLAQPTPHDLVGLLACSSSPFERKCLHFCWHLELGFDRFLVRPSTPMRTTSLRRRIAAEFVGTRFLVATVIGSGIMAERLAGTNVALALLANTIATGAILVALIFTFGGVSGAHFNPAVTVAHALEHGMPWREVPAYIAAQCSGGLTGAIVAHLMFGLPLFSLSRHARTGGAQVFSEFVATFGLLAVIWGCSRVPALGHLQASWGRACLMISTPSAAVLN